MESAVSWCAGGEKGCTINTREGVLKLGEGGRGATAVFSPVSQASPERRHFTQTPSAQDSTSLTLRKVRKTVSQEPRPRDERHTSGLVFGPRQGSAPAFTAISTRPGADFRESPDLLCAPRRKQCSATEGTPSRPAVGALNLLTPFDVPPKCLALRDVCRWFLGTDNPISRVVGSQIRIHIWEPTILTAIVGIHNTKE